MNGGAVSSSGYVTTVSDINWHPEGVGDFNGDGKADVMWRNVATGDVVEWQMNGLSIQQGALVSTLSDVNWSIAAPR